MNFVTQKDYDKMQAVVEISEDLELEKIIKERSKRPRSEYTNF